MFWGIHMSKEYTVNNLPDKLEVGDIVRFNYTGKEQEWIPSNYGVAKIKIECFGGAAPGYGYGGYASGNLTLASKDILYIYCGGKGTTGTSTTYGKGGWNGGGNPVELYSTACYGGGGGTDVRINGKECGGKGTTGTSTTYGKGGWNGGGNPVELYSTACYGGGGGTDVRINGKELSDRVIVAAGGSIGANAVSGHGGGLTGKGWGESAGTQTRGGINNSGNNGSLGKGGDARDYGSGVFSAGGGGGYYGGAGSSAGTQTRGGINNSGNNGSLGKGGDARDYGSGVFSAGGGGGYYGGAGSSRTGTGNDNNFATGGGSSYIDGVEEGKTFDGSTSYGNRDNGYVKITILDTIPYVLNILDKQDVYVVGDAIKFKILVSVPHRLEIKIGNIKIKEFLNPNLNEELTFYIDNKNFLAIPNGTFYLSFIFFNAQNIEVYEQVEIYKKQSNKMTIITTPINVDFVENMIVHVNMKIRHYEDIKIEVCNNGFDREPTWEDNTNRILRGLNILLKNKEKIHVDWGLAFKITALGEFEMDDLITGGYRNE